MHALRRIHGDAVLDIIPKDVRDAVDAVYRFGKVNPEAYQYTLFDDPEAHEDAKVSIRAYCEMADGAGYTLYTTADQDPCLMVWRVIDRKVRKGRSGAPPAA